MEAKLIKLIQSLYDTTVNHHMTWNRGRSVYEFTINFDELCISVGRTKFPYDDIYYIMIDDADSGETLLSRRLTPDEVPLSRELKKLVDHLISTSDFTEHVIDDLILKLNEYRGRHAIF